MAGNDDRIPASGPNDMIPVKPPGGTACIGIDEVPLTRSTRWDCSKPNEANSGKARQGEAEARPGRGGAFRYYSVISSMIYTELVKRALTSNVVFCKLQSLDPSVLTGRIMGQAMRDRYIGVRPNVEHLPVGIATVFLQEVTEPWLITLKLERAKLWFWWAIALCSPDDPFHKGPRVIVDSDGERHVVPGGRHRTISRLVALKEQLSRRGGRYPTYLHRRFQGLIEHTIVERQHGSVPQSAGLIGLELATVCPDRTNLTKLGREVATYWLYASIASRPWWLGRGNVYVMPRARHKPGKARQGEAEARQRGEP